MNLDIERKKALDFLAGDPSVMLEGRTTVPPSRNEPEVIGSQKRKTPKTKILNPRLKTEEYLKQIGKL